ncbi:MAG TPA: nucleotidyltransferase family protein [Planctomycetota bacterium]|nr:nucleotidyltransferase family protein [Planctomycetota bacterium]
MIEPKDLPMDGLSAFCKRWKVKELALFGSALRDDFGPESDIDFLVTFQSQARWSLFDHVQMEEELEALLGRSVDLVTRPAIERSQNYIHKAEILSSAKILYAA